MYSYSGETEGEKEVWSIPIEGAKYEETWVTKWGDLLYNLFSGFIFLMFAP